MNIANLRKGMVVDYHHEPVEVVSFDYASQLVEVRRFDNHECISANCDDLTEDPQLHPDCLPYY